MRTREVVVLSMLCMVGCVADSSDNIDEFEFAQPEETSEGAEVREVVNAATTTKHWWGYTDCVDKGEADYLIYVFSNMALLSVGATELIKDKHPWAALVGTVVGGGYWGWVAGEFAFANNAPGSKGVCVDWPWVAPWPKDIYPWIDEPR